MKLHILILASTVITPAVTDSEPKSNEDFSGIEGYFISKTAQSKNMEHSEYIRTLDGFNSDKLAKELNSAMSDLPSFDSGLVSAVLKDMWSKVNMKMIEK